jgi:hypothetical protein
MIQQFLGLPGVLAGNQVGFAKNSKSAQGDVLEVPDRSAHKVKGPLPVRRETSDFRNVCTFHA